MPQILKKEKRDYLRFERLFKSALRSDIDDLLREFSKGPHTYDAFIQAYNAVDFWMIAIGRVNLAEEYEFVEDFFRYTSAYMFPVEMRKNAHDATLGASAVDEDTAAIEQLFGIFLCYTAYFMQPKSDVKLIYIKLEMTEYLPKMMELLVAQRQLHAVFCLQRLITSKAFSIVPFLEDFNPFLVRRYNTESAKNEVALEVAEFERLQKATHPTDLSQLSEVHKKYVALKEKLKVSSTLKSVTDNISNVLGTLEAEARERISKVEEYSNTRKESSFLAKVSAAKHKAVTADIQVSRHRRHIFGHGMEDVMPRNQEDANEEEEEAPTTSKSGRRTKPKAKIDKLQQRAKLATGIARGKTDRIRRTTCGEDASEAEITRREVESDVAHAIEVSARRRGKHKDSIRENTSTSRSPTKRKPRGPKIVEGVLLPDTSDATGVLKEALLVLDKQNDTDRALERLRARK